jgi:hypothetical protein
MSDDRVAAMDHAATLRAWRERGADRVDPVRFGFIEGLVRRAAAQSGAARRLLDEKIAGLMVSYGEAVARMPTAAQAPAPAHSPVPTHALMPSRAVARAHGPTLARPPASASSLPPAPRGALGALADLINQRAPIGANTTAAPATSSTAPAYPAAELKALGEVRNTWARLDAEQRLEQALAQVPTNAGPLNSYQLVLRTLMLMREVSPEYLQRFMTHVDALMWLERTTA